MSGELKKKRRAQKKNAQEIKTQNKETNHRVKESVKWVSVSERINTERETVSMACLNRWLLIEMSCNMQNN